MSDVSRLLERGNSSSQSSGKYIIAGGLVLQLVVYFGFFIFVSALFHLRLHRHPLPRSNAERRIPWRTNMYILYLASALIIIRCVFRLIEFLRGFSGYLLSHEVYLYVFDATLMFIVVAVFNVKHPSEMRNILTGRKTVGIVSMKDVIPVSELEMQSNTAGPVATEF